MVVGNEQVNGNVVKMQTSKMHKEAGDNSVILFFLVMANYHPNSSPLARFYLVNLQRGLFSAKGVNRERKVVARFALRAGQDVKDGKRWKYFNVLIHLLRIV